MRVKRKPRDQKRLLSVRIPSKLMAWLNDQAVVMSLETEITITRSDVVIKILEAAQKQGNDE